MNEAETRADHIDPQLAAAGWGVVEDSRIRREFPITIGRLEGAGRRAKALSADYVLEYRNTKLAVVEAKAWDVPAAEGVTQAKEYADKLAIRFTYATNGQSIYAIDMESGGEGDVPVFPSPQELWDRTFAEANEWRDRFAQVSDAGRAVGLGDRATTKTSRSSGSSRRWPTASSASCSRWRRARARRSSRSRSRGSSSRVAGT